MTKISQGNLLWIGTPPVPPQPKPYRLGWNPALSKFCPYGLPYKKLIRASTADPDFVAKTASMVDAIHPAIQAVLADYGFAALPVRTIFDVSEWLNWDGPRGHGGRLTWKTIPGLCMFKGHVLLLCQYHEDMDRPGHKPQENPQGVFNHELGHCLDAALGMISTSPEFLACVAADIEKFSAGDRAIYSYFLQPMPIGPSEIFAECFAAVQGMSTVRYWTQRMPIEFASSHQFVQTLVARLIHSTSNPE